MSTKKIRHILVVDDTQFFRKLIVRCLDKLGYRGIQEAENAATALALLKEEETDLIISDFNMPGMDGVDFYNAVRKLPSSRETPFLLITSEGRNIGLEKIKSSGIERVLIIYSDVDRIDNWLEKTLHEIESQ